MNSCKCLTKKMFNKPPSKIKNCICGKHKSWCCYAEFDVHQYIHHLEKHEDNSHINPRNYPTQLNLKWK